MCSISGELRLYGLIDHRHWLLRSNNILYCMQVRCLAVGCSHHVNSSKILAVWTKRSADTLTNVILSCHSIRDARNLSRVCCYCGYGTTGSSLTARRAACTHTYVTCEGIPDTRCPLPRESRRASAPTHVIGCNNPRDEVASLKKHNLLRYSVAPQHLCETCRCGKRAQISELEHTIAVRGPQSQRKSSSADAPVCKDRERKQ